eukprot:7455131-Karenia_brevis.AAC.1
MPDEEFDELCQQLEAKRMERAAEGVGVGSGHFRLTMLQGPTTMKLLGRAYDACKAYASGQTART